MRRRRSTTVSATFGLLVSMPLFLAASYVFIIWLLDFRQQRAYSHLRPELPIAGYRYLSRILLVFGISVLSFICAVTAVGILRDRTLAIRATRFVISPLSWVLFFWSVCVWLTSAPLPGGSLMVVDDGLIPAIIAIYVLPWFLIINLWWLILFRRKTTDLATDR
jgi:hypothetical protein